MCTIIDQPKCFKFKNLQTNQIIAYQFNHQNSFTHAFLRLLIQAFTRDHPSNQKRVFSLYNKETDQEIELNDETISNLKDKRRLPEIIHIKFLNLQQESFKIMSHENKKQKIKQRSIRQVTQYVKKWRTLHNTIGPNGKINLQEAAKIVGISKKSLDDYYCQLRLGQKYGFNFRQNIDQKIGVLRTFVKKFRPKHERTNKNQKHPKSLKILQQLQNYKKNQQISSEQKVPSTNFFTQELIEDNIHEIQLSPMQKPQEFEFDNHFSFDLMTGELIDPFVPYTAYEYRNFKKKQFMQSFQIEKYPEEEILELQPMPW